MRQPEHNSGTRRAGNRRAAQQDGEEFDYDEIAATFKVRYMTAMEAYLRLHSYKIVQMSHQIYTLSVHNEMGQAIVIEEGHEEEGVGKLSRDTRLTAFFKLCKDDRRAANLTYDQVPYNYRYLPLYLIFVFSGKIGFILAGIMVHVRGSEENTHFPMIQLMQKCLYVFTRYRQGIESFSRLGNFY